MRSPRIVPPTKCPVSGCPPYVPCASIMICCSCSIGGLRARLDAKIGFEPRIGEVEIAIGDDQRADPRQRRVAGGILRYLGKSNSDCHRAADRRRDADDELADDLLAEARNQRAQIEAYAQLIDRAGLRSCGEIRRIADRDTVEHQVGCADSAFSTSKYCNARALQPGGDLARDHRPEPVPPTPARARRKSDTSADTGPDRMAMKLFGNRARRLAPCVRDGVFGEELSRRRSVELRKPRKRSKYFSERESEQDGFLGIGLMGDIKADGRAPRRRRPRRSSSGTRTRAKAEAIGGTCVAATPAAAAAEADVLITMLETGPVVEAALFGPDGVKADAEARRAGE